MRVVQYLSRDVFVLVSIITLYVSIAHGQFQPMSAQRAGECIALLALCLGFSRGICQPEPRGCSCSVGCILSIGLPLLSLVNLIAPIARGLNQLLVSVLFAEFVQLLVLVVALYIMAYGIGSIFGPSKAV